MFSFYKGLFFLLLLLSSCVRKDLENLQSPDWNPAIAVPLVKSYFQVEDIINKFETGGFIKTDSTDLITVVYTGEVISITGENLIPVPDQSFVALDSSSDLNFNFAGGDLIKFMLVKSGTFNYHISSNQLEDIEVTITIPKAYKNGQQFRITRQLTYTGSSIEFNGVEDLSGYLLDFTGNGNFSNRLKVIYTASLASNNQVIELDTFNVSFKNIRYNYMEGIFGLKNFEKKMDTIKLDIFKNWISGTVFIEEPKMEIQIQNSFGMPLTLSLSDFNAISEQVAIPLNGSAFNTGYALEFPDGNSIGSSENTEIELNTNNSNLRNILSFAPNQLNVGFNVTANTNPFTVLGFIRDDSQFSIDVDLEIPLQGRIDNIVLSDTFELAIDTVETIDYADFKLSIENTFPLDLFVQVYFTNADGQVVDSLLDPPKKVLAASSGQLIPSKEETFISFKNEKLYNLFQSDEMIVNARLISTNSASETVRFLSSQSLLVKLGVITGLSPW